MNILRKLSRQLKDEAKLLELEAIELCEKVVHSNDMKAVIVKSSGLRMASHRKKAGTVRN